MNFIDQIHKKYQMIERDNKIFYQNQLSEKEKEMQNLINEK